MSADTRSRHKTSSAVGRVHSSKELGTPVLHEFPPAGIGAHAIPGSWHASCEDWSAASGINWSPHCPSQHFTVKLWLLPAWLHEEGGKRLPTYPFPILAHPCRRAIIWREACYSTFNIYIPSSWLRNFFMYVVTEHSSTIISRNKTLFNLRAILLFPLLLIKYKTM